MELIGVIWFAAWIIGRLFHNRLGSTPRERVARHIHAF